MKNKQVSVILIFSLLVLLLSVGISASTFNIQLPRATYCIIKIKSDGSIENNCENTIKKVTDNLYVINRNSEKTAICVEASNIVIDGLNHSLLGVCKGPKYGIEVKSHFVTIKNLKIERFDEADIYLDGSSNCNISMCIIENWGSAVDAYGIWLWHSSNTVISRNVFKDNLKGSIHLDSSSGNRINKNNITNSNIAINFSGSSNNNRAYENKIGGKCGVGVGSYDSSNNYIYKNNITMSDDGVVLSDSSDSYIFGNTITMNNVGVVLSDSSGNSIYDDNKIENNRDGIQLHNSSNNLVWGNKITSDNIGVTLRNGSSSNNVFTNKITNNRIGVWLFNSSKNNIEKNTITENSECAVTLDISTKNSIFKNQEIADNPNGVRLLNSLYNDISENNIQNYSNDGVYLDRSLNNTIADNTIFGKSTQKGNVSITLCSSLNNTISANILTNNNYGLSLLGSSGNTISGNTIANNEIMSISLDHTASNNFIYHNNFMDRTCARAFAMNVWDNGTSKEEEKKAGNYWSDYDGVDEGGDGIGDRSYLIEDDNQDSYPLIAPRGPIPFLWNEVKYDCTFEGNATISICCASAFDDEDKTISFNINLANKNGLFNVEIPRTLLDGQFSVTIDGTPVSSILCWNKIYTSICFEASIRQFDEDATYNVRVKADTFTPLKADVNDDGIVDLFDVVFVAIHLGEKA